jgi:hypothetical protein
MKNRYFYIYSIFFFISTSLFSQIQIGDNIIGEYRLDQSGYSVSMPDSKTIAIGAPYNKVNNSGNWYGHVRVYRWNGNSWIQKGLDFDGQTTWEKYGLSVSMPNPNTIAIGGPRNNGFQLGGDWGYVQIFRWNGTSWIQRGLDIKGGTSGEQSGWSVSMPDTNTVAIGAIHNHENFTNAGQVKVYSWNGLNWVQKGQRINGENGYDLSGTSVSMPNSNILAIGSPDNDGNGSDAGHVRVYSWNGLNWIQKGNDIDGEAPGDESGHSISMPDQNTIAIGAPYNDGNGNMSGHVRIYSWKGNSWIQKGIDIDGEDFGDYSGWSVSMPDSNTVGIGAISNRSNGIRKGHVRLYKWNGNSWNQKGVDIDGLSFGDQFGYSLSMPDSNFIGIGAALYSAQDTGNVGVYKFCSSTTLYPLVCDSFISPSGRYIWKSSGVYLDTIPTTIGCDSFIVVNLVFPNLNKTISNFTSSLASNDFSANYQWIDCDNNYSIIPNETNQLFTPISSGNYAVIVSKNGCSDTSACENVSVVGLIENTKPQIFASPNPTNSKVLITLGKNNLNINLKVNNVNGKVMFLNKDVNTNSIQLDLSNYPKGIYFISIHNSDFVKVIKVMKN